MELRELYLSNNAKLSAIPSTAGHLRCVYYSVVCRCVCEVVGVMCLSVFGKVCTSVNDGLEIFKKIFNKNRSLQENICGCVCVQMCVVLCCVL